MNSTISEYQNQLDMEEHPSLVSDPYQQENSQDPTEQVEHYESTQTFQNSEEVIQNLMAKINFLANELNENNQFTEKLLEENNYLQRQLLSQQSKFQSLNHQSNQNLNFNDKKNFYESKIQQIQDEKQNYQQLVLQKNKEIQFLQEKIVFLEKNNSILESHLHRNYSTIQPVNQQEQYSCQETLQTQGFPINSYDASQNNHILHIENNNNNNIYNNYNQSPQHQPKSFSPMDSPTSHIQARNYSQSKVAESHVLTQSQQLNLIPNLMTPGNNQFSINNRQFSNFTTSYQNTDRIHKESIISQQAFGQNRQQSVGNQKKSINNMGFLLQSPQNIQDENQIQTPQNDWKSAFKQFIPKKKVDPKVAQKYARSSVNVSTKKAVGKQHARNNSKNIKKNQ